MTHPIRIQPLLPQLESMLRHAQHFLDYALKVHLEERGHKAFRQAQLKRALERVAELTLAIEAVRNVRVPMPIGSIGSREGVAG